MMMMIIIIIIIIIIKAITLSGKCLCWIDPHMAKRLTIYAFFVTYDKWDLKFWSVCSRLQNNITGRQIMTLREVKRNKAID